MHTGQKARSKDVETSMSCAGIVSATLGHPRWFSWAWTRDGETVASIQVESGRDQVTLKYRSRSYGEEWSDVRQTVPLKWTPCRFGGERPWFVCSVYQSVSYCGRNVSSYMARKAICVPSLPRPRLCQPTRILQPTRPLPRSKNSYALGRERQHVRRFPGQAQGNALADLRSAARTLRYGQGTIHGWIRAFPESARPHPLLRRSPIVFLGRAAGLTIRLPV